MCIAQTESQLNIANNRVKTTEGVSCDDEGSGDRSLFVVLLCFAGGLISRFLVKSCDVGRVDLSLVV